MSVTKPIPLAVIKDDDRRQSDAIPIGLGIFKDGVLVNTRSSLNFAIHFYARNIQLLLEPLYLRMARLIILSSKLHTDATLVLLLDPGRGKTQTARFWVYVAFAARKQLRDEFSTPILDTWMTARLADTLPKSPLGLAIGYVRNQWLALKRFLENGALEIDNNTAENALRPIALGRKNYLFVGSEHGGRRAAIIYSLIRTCERHGVNAWDYLRDVLVRISTHPATQIDDLLPHRWKPATK